ncbi:MAG: penicillin-binding protein 2 [Anaerolineaceae bacterium]|nr:MAG: penicillin-binding protein 2 [Anaerolineaceae bacterium]
MKEFSMRQEYAWRSMFVAALLPLFALTILGQIVRIQTSDEAQLFRDQANEFAMVKRTFYPERGEIYDRNGHLLAGNETIYTVGVNIPDMIDASALAREVSAQLGLDYEETYQKLLNPYGLIFVPLKNFVRADELAPLKETFEQMKKDAAAAYRPSALSGLEFQPTLQRSYPENELASNIIGFFNRDSRGNFGVEEKYNDLLAGTPVEAWVPQDPNRAAEIPKAPDGTTLILTIDRDLQAAAEQSLDQALFEYGAHNGSIVIMDPRNGEILAMATTPRLNLNEFWRYGEYYSQSYEYNPAISMQYEPGSVFKILTMAAGLDSGAVTRDTLYNDLGSIVVGEVLIQNWDRRPWGVQDMTGCLQHSLNVCHAWISTSMGQDIFYGYMQRFGVGRPTGVDLAGETAGRLKVPGDADWYPVDLGTNAFGQGVAVSPIQMLMAASAIANDGYMVTPHVLYGMVSEGRQVNIHMEPAGMPIRTETAHILSDMLATSLESEASLALVPGYRVAGKTGTAEIPVNGYYDSSLTNVSFIGWGPVDDPQFIIYVWIERPSTSIWANDTAAPLFSEIAQKTVILLNIPPDIIRHQIAGQ